MIRFEKICKVYDGFQAVRNIDLHVNKGELLVLIGPSGSGKTTTMRMINRLVEPTSGKIWVNGAEIGKQDPVELRRTMGYVIQHIGLLPHLTIAENSALVPRLKGMDKAAYAHRVDELLDMVGLDPSVYRDRYPAELSGGQQQRVGVVRALAVDPPIILMDEPFSALDPISREQLQDELIRLQDELHKTIVFVTHDMDEALKIADRICLMQNGEIVQLDTPEHLLRHPANDFVRSFVGEQRMSEAATLPSIGEVMLKPITARPSRGLAEAILTMRKHRVTSLMVVDKQNRLLGVARSWAIQQHYREENMALQDVMTTDVPTVKIEQPLVDAIELMRQNQVAYLPVIDATGVLKGVITQASLVNAMAETYVPGVVLQPT